MGWIGSWIVCVGGQQPMGNTLKAPRPRVKPGHLSSLEHPVFDEISHHSERNESPRSGGGTRSKTLDLDGLLC